MAFPARWTEIVRGRPLAPTAFGEPWAGNTPVSRPETPALDAREVIFGWFVVAQAAGGI